jgi:hypothetical protein
MAMIKTETPAAAARPAFVINTGSNGNRGAVFGITPNQVTL